MNNVVFIKPCLNIPETLRVIAEEIEKSEEKPRSLTMVIDANALFQLGIVDDLAAMKDTVFNCQWAIQMIMQMDRGEE